VGEARLHESSGRLGLEEKKAGGAGFQGPSWQANWMDAAMTQKGAPGESHRERADMEVNWVMMMTADDDVPVWT
jgi:hypothetical protein